MTKRKTAVYLDHKHAYILANHVGHEVTDFALIDSTDTDKVNEPLTNKQGSEYRIHNTEQGELRKFFKSISEQLTNTQELYLTGFGTAQEEFKHYLQDTAQFKNLDITLGTTDNIDEAAFKRHALAYFNK